MPTMTAALLAGPRTFEVKDIDVPALEAGGVLVRVRQCGVCGSDLHFYRGDLPLPPGTCMGHEIGGEVAEVGPGVQDFRPGDRVCVEPLLVCGTCQYCRSGQYQLCRQRRLLGTPLPGGFARYVQVPAYCLYRLPDAIDFEVGSLIEPLAVAVHGLRLASLSVGDRVLVLGAGTIGLMAVLVSREMGATSVVACGRYGHQRETALTLGAESAVEDSEEALAGLSGPAWDSPFDLVVEAVGGHADTLSRAVSLARFGGRVAVLGLFTRPVTFNAMSVMVKETQLIGAITYGRAGTRSDFAVALDIAARQATALRSLVTHRLPLERTGEAFETAADKKTGSMKVSVLP
ncbi:MAG: alcohol dehydrogenase catalytic domain-containing protein [Dehalococcoidia bacterium]